MLKEQHKLILWGENQFEMRNQKFEDLKKTFYWSMEQHQLITRCSQTFITILRKATCLKHNKQRGIKDNSSWRTSPWNNTQST